MSEKVFVLGGTARQAEDYIATLRRRGISTSHMQVASTAIAFYGTTKPKVVILTPFYGRHDSVDIMESLMDRDPDITEVEDW